MISVCIATYNGGKFIEEQLKSILSQLSEKDEVIISDDESTDNTTEIIEGFNDPRIKIFHHIKSNESGVYSNFRYATSNFENALKHSTGDYIFLSDQDDVWESDKISRCLELLKEYDCVVHNYSIIDEKGVILKKYQFEKIPIHRSIIMNIMDNHFRGCCMAFNKRLLAYILPIPKKVIGHDYWIGTLAAHYGKVFYETKTLIQSRWYSESVSAKKKTSIIYKLHFRIDLLIETLKRIINNY